jgi:hypothetical protein
MLGDKLYHGTTASAGHKIAASGWLTPRGARSSNWDRGLFGGDPSAEDLVYVTDREGALYYMKEVCRMSRTSRGAVLKVEMDWGNAVLDEDLVADILVRTKPGSGKLTDKVWRAYAKFLDASPAAAYQIFNDLEVQHQSDSQYAQDMKDTARLITNPRVVRELSKGTVASSVPLRVLEIEYFKVK